MDEGGSEDRRLTMDLVALYDITREYAVDLEYVLAELMDAADTAVARELYEG
ncbi:hypothetical protein [Rhodococcus sp. Q]|uniref:hypothetical protein n=1 Tax=Rhodococcus sp. Q TaxID=2502252 RepID=UPI001485B89C|nr:hypothetical protein [Rhodococcus sp. Q]